MSKIKFSQEYLQENCVDYKLIQVNDDWKSFKKSNRQYVFLLFGMKVMKYFRGVLQVGKVTELENHLFLMIN